MNEIEEFELEELEDLILQGWRVRFEIRLKEKGINCHGNREKASIQEERVKASK